MNCIEKDVNASVHISRLISSLRFPMTAGVVMIHCGVVSLFMKKENGEELVVAKYLEDFSHSALGICVPLFFFISGYLFFLKGEWNWSKYLQKLRSRFHSLFIPYVIYTVMAITIFGVMQEVMPQLQSGSHVPIKEWSILDFIKNGLWRYGDENIPFCGALWYIRNLMMVVLLSPLVYAMIRHVGKIGIIILGVLCCTRIWTFGIPGTLALFYFSWGGYFSMNGKDFTKTFRPYLPLGWLSIPLFIADAATKCREGNPYLHQVAVLVGVLFAICIADKWVRTHDSQPKELLLSSTFFVYAIHTPYLGQFAKMLVAVVPVPPNPIWGNIFISLVYFAYWVIVVAALVAIYALIRRMNPKIAAILSGGR